MSQAACASAIWAAGRIIVRERMEEHWRAV
jgi:hypothetical protein